MTHILKKSKLFNMQIYNQLWSENFYFKLVNLQKWHWLRD